MVSLVCPIWNNEQKQFSAFFSYTLRGLEYFTNTVVMLVLKAATSDCWAPEHSNRQATPLHVVVNERHHFFWAVMGSSQKCRIRTVYELFIHCNFPVIYLLLDILYY